MPSRPPSHRPSHLPEKRDAGRQSAHRRGYGRRWRSASKRFLAQPENRLCVECKRRGRVVMATAVDHIVPHRGDWKLFWNEDNWQGLCKPCHDRKTGGGL